jgi:hypothetical protein
VLYVSLMINSERNENSSHELEELQVFKKRNMEIKMGALITLKLP